MDTPFDWRSMLLKYRLNEVDEARREEIDSLLLTDTDFAAAMQEAEYDLLDAYAAGELSAEEMRRVERGLDPVGRFSPALAGHVILSQADSGVRRGFVPRLSFWRMAAAAALVVGAVAGVVAYRHISRAHPSVTGRSEAAVSPPAAPRSESNTEASILTAPARPAAKQSETQATAVVVLAGALRSRDALPVSIGGEVKSVRFLWPPAPGLPSKSRYELQVVREDGSVSCRSVAVVRVASDRLGFSCPAASVSSGVSFVRVMELPLSPDAAPVFEVSLAVTRN